MMSEDLLGRYFCKGRTEIFFLWHRFSGDETRDLSLNNTPSALALTWTGAAPAEAAPPSVQNMRTFDFCD
jgi:hypothetical protein